MKRTENEHRHEVTFFMIMLVLVILACGYFVLRVHAQESSAVESKLITVHTVQSGESLLELAMEYSDPLHYQDYEAYVREVVFTNHLSERRLYSGQQLFLPYYR